MSRQAAEGGTHRAQRRRAAQLVGGSALLVAGGALLVLPGPGIPLVVAGLVVLGRQYEWPRRLRRRVASWSGGATRRFRD
ncbi:MAG TPA: PGPGW domain-containing protein [Polyangiaceae bacterium]|nr:PGPGW domain-containing protein [Polyangiaceae bacterium]